MCWNLRGVKCKVCCTYSEQSGQGAGAGGGGVEWWWFGSTVSAGKWEVAEGESLA